MAAVHRLTRCKLRVQRPPPRCSPKRPRTSSRARRSPGAAGADLVQPTPVAPESGDPPPHRCGRRLPNRGGLSRPAGAVLAEQGDGRGSPAAPGAGSRWLPDGASDGASGPGQGVPVTPVSRAANPIRDDASNDGVRRCPVGNGPFHLTGRRRDGSRACRRHASWLRRGATVDECPSEPTRRPRAREIPVGQTVSRRSSPGEHDLAEHHCEVGGLQCCKLGSGIEHDDEIVLSTRCSASNRVPGGDATVLGPLLSPRATTVCIRPPFDLTWPKSADSPPDHGRRSAVGSRPRPATMWHRSWASRPPRRSLTGPTSSPSRGRRGRG